MGPTAKRSKGPENFGTCFSEQPTTRKTNVLATRHVPPQRMGIIPNDTDSFDNAGKAARVFYENEILPPQTRFEELNEWAGERVVGFGEYALAMGV
ncbi:hypothetical protein [Chromobacterium violaceum]|uniref:hypothetical protein n=1 Tax=Chromobacterium violaceum TaxID=536 RepID=UPI0012D4670E|nr:hypothetical protein [Chromobacterium violaceum]